MAESEALVAHGWKKLHVSLCGPKMLIIQKYFSTALFSWCVVYGSEQVVYDSPLLNCNALVTSVTKYGLRIPFILAIAHFVWYINSVQFSQPLTLYCCALVLIVFSQHRITEEKSKIMRQKDCSEAEIFGMCKQPSASLACGIDEDHHCWWLVLNKVDPGSPDKWPRKHSDNTKNVFVFSW